MTCEVDCNPRMLASNSDTQKGGMRQNGNLLEIRVIHVKRVILGYFDLFWFILGYFGLFLVILGHFFS